MMVSLLLLCWCAGARCVSSSAGLVLGECLMYNGRRRARASLWHGHVPGLAVPSVPDIYLYFYSCNYLLSYLYLYYWIYLCICFCYSLMIVSFENLLLHLLTYHLSCPVVSSLSYCFHILNLIWILLLL